MTALYRLLARTALSLVLLMTHVTALQAQQPVVEVYRVRIVTTSGHSFRGKLLDVDSSFIYTIDSRVPLNMVRKVVLRRNDKKRVQLVGVALGAIAGGYLASLELQKNPTRGAGLQGVTVVFSALGGALVGLLAGSVVGNLNSRVIRPPGSGTTSISLYGELKPFAQRHQQDMIDHLNTSRQR